MAARHGPSAHKTPTLETKGTTTKRREASLRSADQPARRRCARTAEAIAERGDPVWNPPDRGNGMQRGVDDAVLDGEGFGEQRVGLPCGVRCRYSGRAAGSLLELRNDARRVHRR